MKQRAIRHFRDVFHWSPGHRGEVAQALAAALGMAGPVLAGVLSGNRAAGFAAALGGLAASRVEAGANVRDHVRRGLQALAPTVLAAVAAVVLAGGGRLAAVGRLAVVIAAAALGGFSRPMAVASTRFIVFLMIVGALPALSLRGGLGLLAMIVLGTVWTSALGLGFAALIHRFGPEPREPRTETPAVQPSAARRLSRFLARLKSLDGWNYPIRLGAALSAADLAQWIWPRHHLHWIGLTVALLTARQSKPNAVKTTQRTLGTGIGVLLAGLAPWSPLPGAALVVLVGGLAGARSHFGQRNYLAYSAVMTLLVMLVMDAGRPPDASLLADRLWATVAGGLLVTLADRAIGRPAPSGAPADG